MALAGLVACGGGGTKTAASPTPTKSVLDGCIVPAVRDAVASGTEVRLTASDGVQIAGVVWGTGARAVVLGHMGGRSNNVCDWAVFARTLASRGYLALAIDFRNFGSSGVANGAGRFRQDLDVAAAVAEVRRRGAQKVVIGGASLGGIASMIAALTIKPPVSGVMNVAGPAVVETMKANPSAITVPVLYVVAEADLEQLQGQVRAGDAGLHLHRDRVATRGKLSGSSCSPRRVLKI